MFWTDIARFLQYFRNLSNTFINTFGILQDFNGIFSKYSFNNTVLYGIFQAENFFCAGAVNSNSVCIWNRCSNINNVNCLVIISTSETKTVETERIKMQNCNWNLKTIGKSIGSWFGNYFQTLTCDWKDPEEGKWVPYELKERDITRRKTTCEI